ncbi:MAG: hypothetical protein ACI8ZM_003375 [Crocinitomix sp.]|jgi:hypothetical protein
MSKPIYWKGKVKENAIEFILTRISNGESCRSILDKADRKIYPSHVTFCQWLSNDNELAKQYARSAAERADLIFDEILTIADSFEKDVTIVNGKEVINHNIIHRHRLMIDTRKWMLSKMMPKKYGDKLDVTSAGEATHNPVNIVFTNSVEREKRIAELKKKLG